MSPIYIILLEISNFGSELSLVRCVARHPEHAPINLIGWRLLCGRQRPARVGTDSQYHPLSGGERLPLGRESFLTRGWVTRGDE